MADIDASNAKFAVVVTRSSFRTLVAVSRPGLAQQQTDAFYLLAE